LAAFVKFNSFTEAVHKKVHNLGSDTIMVALCAAANAPVATNTQLSQLTQISYTNLSSRVVTITSAVQTAGQFKWVLQDLVLTASGAVPAFRYVVVYNDTATNKELIGYIDYGSDQALATGETYTVDFDQTNGVFTSG